MRETTSSCVSGPVSSSRRRRWLAIPDLRGSWIRKPSTRRSRRASGRTSPPVLSGHPTGHIDFQVLDIDRALDLGLRSVEHAYTLGVSALGRDGYLASWREHLPRRVREMHEAGIGLATGSDWIEPGMKGHLVILEGDPLSDPDAILGLRTVVTDGVVVEEAGPAVGSQVAVQEGRVTTRGPARTKRCTARAPFRDARKRSERHPAGRVCPPSGPEPWRLAPGPEGDAGSRRSMDHARVGVGGKTGRYVDAALDLENAP